MPNISRSPAAHQPTPAYVARRWAWIALLGGASIGFGLAFACATPFVALVTLAALTMSRRDAFIVTGAVWLANQAVGYGILDYPRTFDSYAWGVAIGMAVLLALLAARAVGDRFERRGPIVSTGVASCRRSPSTSWRSMQPPSGFRAATRRFRGPPSATFFKSMRSAWLA